MEPLEPSWSEFKDFNLYVSSILHLVEANGAVCIKPPPQWQHLGAPDLDRVLNWKITPSLYTIKGSDGDVTPGKQPILVRNWVQRKKKIPDSERIKLLESLDSVSQTEWSSAFQDVQYCTEVDEGTLFSSSLKEWNLSKLPDYYNTCMRKLDYEIQGSTIPTLFVAEMGSPFFMHTEEMNLYSIIYVHTGAPKIWYTIKSSSFNKVCGLYSKLVPKYDCTHIWCHKVAFPSPTNRYLRGIPVQKFEQRAGQFVIVGPKVFHWGFNKGYNVAEGCHFAPRSWVPIGEEFVGCPGHPDMNPPTEPTLSFSMDLFKSDDNPGNSKKNVSGGLKRGRKPSKIGPYKRTCPVCNRPFVSTNLTKHLRDFHHLPQEEIEAKSLEATQNSRSSKVNFEELPKTLQQNWHDPQTRKETITFLKKHNFHLTMEQESSDSE